MFEPGGVAQALEAEPSSVLSGVPEVEWAAVLREQQSGLARVQFRQVQAVGVVFLARCADDARRGCNEAFQGEFAAAEVALMLRWTEACAHRVIGLALDLRWRLHATSAAFESGRIDQARAQAISEALANVSADKVESVERLLLDGVDHLSTTMLRRKARQLVARHDPDGARTRREAADASRDVRFRANEDGTCAVEGTLPGPGGQVVAMRLRKMCFDVCARDPRSHAQRRADALVALASGAGYLACLCGRGGDCDAKGVAAERHSEPERGKAASDGNARTSGASPTNAGASAGGRADANIPVALPPLPPTTVHVGVNVTTLLGLDDIPGLLAGHGPIDADLARQIAADGTWRKVLTLTDADRDAILDALAAHDTSRGTSPAHGPILGVGRALTAAGITPSAIRERTRTRREQLIYRPSAHLAEIVRTRDGTCRFPGCTVRAIACDLDHTIPFDHACPQNGGLTVEQNLACLCRRHHRLKTHGLWTVRQLGAGRLEWTTPSGDLVCTKPGGAFAGTADARAVADAELAAAHGLTLTDRDTLARLTDPHHARGAEADLDYILAAHPPPIEVDVRLPVAHDPCGTDPAPF